MRSWLSPLLPQRPARDDLLIVATELGSDALEHTASGQAGGWFAVEVTGHQSTLQVAVADGVPVQGAGLESGPVVPVSGLRWRRAFPGNERQLGVLRRWLASLLPGCSARDDVLVAANELATNALSHTASGQGGSFAVEVIWHRQVVRIAVGDGGAAEGPRIIEAPAGDHGRGLLLVRALSVRMGVCGDHRGRLVWADVPWDEALAPGPTPSEARFEAAIRRGEAQLGGIRAWIPGAADDSVHRRTASTGQQARVPGLGATVPTSLVSA